MPLNLPSRPPIDRTRAGVLRISAAILGDLLGLPASAVVTRALSSQDGSELMVRIEGEPMPPCEPGQAACDVSLVLHQAFDVETELFTVTANFEHEPAVSWVMQHPHKRERVE